ncbi:MAG: hypothetical protein AAFN30_08010, partial [Actinomycetota bacterium]
DRPVAVLRREDHGPGFGRRRHEGEGLVERAQLGLAARHRPRDQGRGRAVDSDLDVHVAVERPGLALQPAAEAGTVILTTEDGDGSVVAASVVRVLFTR